MDIGIIVEDQSDLDVLREITLKFRSPGTFKFRPYIAQGCAKLRRKCTSVAINMRDAGYRHVVVVHDLDEEDATSLRNELEGKVRHVGFRSHVILIPVREMESWLLTDSEALRTVFKMSKAPRVPGNPETVVNPKEYLRDLVWRNAKIRYVNTIYNGRIAAALRAEKLNSCRSFLAYPTFLGKLPRR